MVKDYHWTVIKFINYIKECDVIHKELMKSNIEIFFYFYFLKNNLQIKVDNHSKL